MEDCSRVGKVVMYQHVAFLGIILLCYLNELLQLPALIFSGHPFAFVFRRSTLEMLLVLGIWLLVSNSTRRLLKRVRQLESFMRVCSWCRRIHHKDEWMPIETFMKHGFDTSTTHGICPDCFRQQTRAAKRRKRGRKQPAPLLGPNPSSPGKPAPVAAD